MSALYRDEDGFDSADYIGEAYEGEAHLLFDDVACIPPSNRRVIISRVIGPNGSMIKLLQHKHACRISYVRSLHGFLIAGGSRRKIAAAKRDVLAVAAAVPEIATERLPFDVRIIRGPHGERMTMIQRCFGVRIDLRPLLKPLHDDDTESLFARCFQSPFGVEATISGRRGAVERVMRYYEVIDEEAARRHS